MFKRTTLKTLLTASVCLISSAAFADHGGGDNDSRGNSDSHISATGATARAANSDADLVAHPRSTFIAGVGPTSSATTTLLRFTNIGTDAGSATVTLYAADTGTQLATWTSASIPSFGSLQIDLSALIAAATPALTTAQASAALDLGVSGGFKGTVQHLLVANDVASNLSRCAIDGSRKVFGAVAGPGNLDLSSAIEIGNRSDQAQTVTLTLHSSVDGTVLGTWTSPSIPAHGSITVTASTLASAATPVVPATTASFTVEASSLTGGVVLAHLSQPKAGGIVTDLSQACRIAETADGDADADDTVSTP